jgi:hypothetical protein
MLISILWQPLHQVGLLAEHAGDMAVRSHQQVCCRLWLLLQAYSVLLLLLLLLSSLLCWCDRLAQQIKFAQWGSELEWITTKLYMCSGVQKGYFFPGPLAGCWVVLMV